MEQYFLLLMGPVFMGFMAWEARYWYKRGRQSYTWTDTLSNMSLAFLHQLGEFLAMLLLIHVFQIAYAHRLWTIPTNVVTVLALFVLQDFCFYWFHRCSHQIRWMWASHVTHHSSTRLNLSTALRQSLTYPISGMWVFWVPLAFVGFDVKLVLFVVALNLFYQFFIHTEAVGKLGWLEKHFNTPSHHRVHHARNPGYFNHNYAAVLMWWDKLFGTFTLEDPARACDYGIPRPITSHNPLTLTFHEWRDMLRAARCAPTWSQRLRHLFGDPEWQDNNPQ